MLTKWGKRVAGVATADYNLPSASPNPNGVAIIEAKETDGTIIYITPAVASAPNTAYYSSAIPLAGRDLSGGVAVGSSDSSESENDYTLGQQIIGLSGSISSNKAVDTENKKYIVIFDITLTNNTGADVTVREVGRFATYYFTATYGGNPSTSASASRACVMIDRSVLADPVTIPNGEARVVRYIFAYDVS